MSSSASASCWLPLSARSALSAVHAALIVLVVSACASAGPIAAQNPPSTGVLPADSLNVNMVPAGFGSLRQDDVAVKVTPPGGLQVRAVPMDEEIIRLLSPDAYRSLRELLASKSREVAAVKDRFRLPSYSYWYVSFYTLEQGETRFSPSEFIINNVGRDFRPIDILALSTGFGENRLKQREVQSAILIFDGQLDINQPLTVQMQGTESQTRWVEVLRRVERERALVRSRAAAKS